MYDDNVSGVTLYWYTVQITSGNKMQHIQLLEFGTTQLSNIITLLIVLKHLIEASIDIDFSSYKTSNSMEMERAVLIRPDTVIEPPLKRSILFLSFCIRNIEA